MNFASFLYILDYLEKSINESNIIGLYQELFDLLNQLQQSPSEELTNNVTEKRQQIIDIQLGLQPQNWDYLKLKIFREFGASELIGEGAIRNLEKVFNTNMTNPSTAAQKIQEVKDKTSTLLQNIQNIKNGLGNLSAKPPQAQLEGNERILELVFDNAVSVKTLNDLEKVSKEWRLIISYFSQLVGEPSEEAKIYSIQQGSLVIVAAVSKKVAEAISLCVEKVLDCWKKKLEVDQIKEQVKKAKLENEFLEVKLDEEKFLKKNREEVVTILMEKFRKDAQEVDGDTKTRLEDGVKRIYRFIDKGGIVDTSSEETAQPTLTQMQLSKKYEEAKQLADGLEHRVLIAEPDEEKDEEVVEKTEEIQTPEAESQESSDKSETEQESTN